MKKVTELESKISQLGTVVDTLYRENNELKAMLSSQRFVIQPVQYPQNGANSESASTNPSRQPVGSTQGSSSSQNVSAEQQAQFQQRTRGQIQAQSAHSSTNGSGSYHSNNNNNNNNSGNAESSRANIDTGLNEGVTNNGILRFINNQYVDESDTNLQTSNSAAAAAAAAASSLSNSNSNSANTSSTTTAANGLHQAQSTNNTSRLDFVFMDPANGKGRGMRAGQQSQLVQHNSVIHPHLQRSGANGANINEEVTVKDANGNIIPTLDGDNYDLLIHNNFEKVDDIYYEFHNSLKPQVDRVQKAYKIKKIRKFQKIKALAVRIDRFKESNNCSLQESFDFFENLRLTSDGKKKSIAWLYNSLPEVLKQMHMGDDMKKL